MNAASFLRTKGFDGSPDTIVEVRSKSLHCPGISRGRELPGPRASRLAGLAARLFPEAGHSLFEAQMLARNGDYFGHHFKILLGHPGEIGAAVFPEFRQDDLLLGYARFGLCNVTP
jgi:hypothetical protein